MSRVVSDETWALLTILGEARGESFLGKVAVAEVIRTRALRRYLSDGTLTDTVLRSNQFSCWNQTDTNRIVMARTDADTPEWADAVRAWEESVRTITTRGATHYLNPSLVTRPPAWYDPAKVTLRVGGHEFLRV